MTDKQSDPSSLSLSFIEALYAQYLQDPHSVAPDWQRYFEEQTRGECGAHQAAPGPSFRPWSVFNPPGGQGADSQAVRRKAAITALQHRVDQLIRNYRVRGHRVARLDPLGSPLPELPELDPAYYGFTESEMELEFSAGTLGGEDSLSLREILQRLRATYCRSIGAQFMHIDDLSVREWLQRRMEGTQNRLELSREEQLRILTRLTDAVIFEEFIQRKYIGAKRFSLEGAESLIPLLDLAIEQAGRQGYEEIVIGMAHRGRINVLANIMGKSPALIFREFEDLEPEAFLGGGDVKYHLGYHSDWDTTSGQSIHLALCFNPSHLEFVNAVAMGRVRAKQDRLGDAGGEKGMLILIHGDAAFIGEGILQEALNLSELEPYRIGGALHVIVNNQIGFTTTPEEGRSSVYASDVAKMLQSPIFHVNGEDPEAVAQAVHLAMEFRRTFKRDVFVDMYCYRRYGHNETDEPAFTHPVLYRQIQKRKSVREGYLDHLLALGGLTLQEAQEIARQRRNHLEKEIESVRSEAPRLKPDRPSVLGSLWKKYCGGRDQDVDEVDTGVERTQLLSMLDALTRLPAGFHPHPKIKRFLEQRRRMARGETPLDWAAAEALAFATLALEGARVRLTGQDSRRGTFSQRHAVLYDFEDGRPYETFQHLSPDQAPVQIFNSPLSEAGVVAFEYGYSIAYPDALVMWEAQFGDFLNAAQVVIDQFVAGAEDKWKSLSGLVLLLPHGFEGMGPEHSSARLERFLTLAAEDNLQVVYPTTPAQYFHCLRRQVRRCWRKPLVVLTPKSLLRHPRCVSSLEELAQGRFQRILPDAWAKPKRKVERVLLCSGKIYYELEQRREDAKRSEVAILRVEQLYPLSDETLQAALAPYRDGTPVLWVQEEPENMGAWRYWRARLGGRIFARLPFSGVYRPESASPATGSKTAHAIEQERLLNEAFAEG